MVGRWPIDLSTLTAKESAASRPSQCAANYVFQGRLRAGLRCGFDAMVVEDRFDRVARHGVAEPLQPPADAGVAPGRVLVRHAYDERGDVRLGARATRATREARLRAVVLRGDDGSRTKFSRAQCTAIEPSGGRLRQPLGC